MIIKNHPLENGNKRAAVVLTLLFLYLNNKVLDFSPDELYDLACNVAESDASKSDHTIDTLKQVFKNNLRNI